MREGRAPLADEQQAIADEQIRRIAVAAQGGVVVADTTALSIAVYSETLFHDTSLHAAALAAQCRYTFTLLTALDLPWVDDGLQREGAHVREPFDARVRSALAGAGIGYAVVHGSGGQRLANAWNAIHSIASRERPGGHGCPASALLRDGNGRARNAPTRRASTGCSATWSPRGRSGPALAACPRGY